MTPPFIKRSWPSWKNNPTLVAKNYFAFQNAIADENQLLSGAESQQAEVRVAFGEGQGDQQTAASEDQQTAAQTNSASIDEISLDDADNSEENRNKRCALR